MNAKLRILLTLALLMASGPWLEVASGGPVRLLVGRDIDPAALSGLSSIATERGWRLVRLGGGVYLELSDVRQRVAAREQLNLWRGGDSDGPCVEQRPGEPSALVWSTTRALELELLLRGSHLRSAGERSGCDDALIATGRPGLHQPLRGEVVAAIPAVHIPFTPGAHRLRAPPLLL